MYLQNQALRIQAETSIRLQQLTDQTALTDKLIAILSSKSPLEFQAVQAMSGQMPQFSTEDVSPSDESEWERIASRDHLDVLEGGETYADVLANIGPFS
jgi:hypothetical protein